MARIVKLKPKKKPSRKSPASPVPAQKGSKPWKPWDLWESGVSWSFLEVFLRNRAECDLIYRKGLRYRLMPHFIDFGQAFHHIMERGYKLYKSPPSREQCHEMGNGYVIRGLKKGQVTNRVAAQEQADLAATVAHRYFAYYHEDFKWRWPTLETYFSMPYTYPDGKVTRINGIKDALCIDPQGRDFVMDTKTKGDLNEDALLDEFPLNFQVNCYMWDYYRENETFPHGCFLNLVRRPGERLTQKDGSQAGLLNRISGKILDDPKHYFKRPTFVPTAQEMQWWWDNQMVPIMEEVRAWYEGRIPTFINPVGLYVGRRRTDYFDAMVNNDYSLLSQRR